MKLDLSGKAALITGSTSGIGHAIARGLALAGANVVVNGRSQPKVDAAVAALAGAAPGSRVAGLAADVSTAAGCLTLTERLPDVDILINNAGIFEPKDLAKQIGQSVEEAAAQFVKQFRPTSLLQRFASVEEIANMVVYVASREASATNGAALHAEGGIVQTIA